MLEAVHISICFEASQPPPEPPLSSIFHRPQGEIDEQAVDELTSRVRFSWVSAEGCAFLSDEDPAAACRWLLSAHRGGWYADRALHISM